LLAESSSCEASSATLGKIGFGGGDIGGKTVDAVGEGETTGVVSDALGWIGGRAEFDRDRPPVFDVG